MSWQKAALKRGQWDNVFSTCGDVSEHCAVTIGENYGKRCSPDVDGLTGEEDIQNGEETDDVMVQNVPGSLELHIETNHQNEPYSDLR